MYRTKEEKIEDRDGAIMIIRERLIKHHSIIDTETTGSDKYYDEMCQYARLDSDGYSFKSFIKPTIHISEEASRVNNIFDKTVENAPTALDIIGEIPCATIVFVYNADFDINIIRNSVRARGSNIIHNFENHNEFVDVMWVYSSFVGYWNEECNRFGKISLEDACKNCNIETNDITFHDAMCDCILTERLMKFIASQKLSTEL